MQKLKCFIKDCVEAVIGAGVLIVLTLLSAFVGGNLLSSFMLLATLVYIGFIYCRFNVRYKGEHTASGEALSTLTVDVLMKLDVPSFMVGEDDTVAWYNKAFAENSVFKHLKYGQSLKNVCGGALTFAAIKNSACGFTVETDSMAYKLYYVPVDSFGKRYYLGLLFDSTDLKDLNTCLQMSNVVVGYAAVDNAAEISSHIQDSYRALVAKAYTELYNWVGDMGGIIREYDRDKYIIFVDEAHFAPNLVKKFDILDKINSTADGNGSRLTFSMSFARIEGSLSEKEAAAKASLDYAFQRGGAQVIVKTQEGNLSFGGQSKAVERTTKIKSRVTADKLKERISAASNVIVMGHKNIDIDAIAAACAVARLAMELGIKVNIVVNIDDSALDSALALISDLTEYDHVFVDRVRGQELLSADTLVVVVDASNVNIFESVDIFKNAGTVAIIDHHVQTKEFDITPDIQYIDPTASSASELMCEILEHAIPRSAIKTAEAELLYAGIMLDTQKFTRNMGVRTFGAAMYLRPDAKMLARANAVFKPGIHEYTKQAVFQKNTIIFREAIGITHYSDDSLPENRIMASIAADGMLNIASVKAAFALCTIDDGIHISARSDGSINVAKILESLGGGGRFEAAATLLKKMDMKDTMTKLRKAIGDYWDEKFGNGGSEQ